jgi:hypothetical protein
MHGYQNIKVGDGVFTSASISSTSSFQGNTEQKNSNLLKSAFKAKKNICLFKVSWKP